MPWGNMAGKPAKVFTIMEKSEMNFNMLNVTHADGITIIGLNRTNVMNALNLELIRELDRAVSASAENREVRALVIHGEGDHFAAGADISEMADIGPEQAARFSFSPVFNSLAALPMPVIAAIDGYALGGGLELTLACDIRICSPTAKFGLPEANVGIFPGAGGTQRLPQLIGPGRAADLIFTGRIITAETAVSWGLCSRMFDKDVRQAGIDLAGNIAAGPPLALAGAKSAMQTGISQGFNTGISRESELWAGLFSSRDQKEGMTAFLEKRKPQFKGC